MIKKLFFFFIINTAIHGQVIAIDSESIFLLENLKPIEYHFGTDSPTFNELQTITFDKTFNGIDFGSRSENLWLKFQINYLLSDTQSFVMELIDPEIDEFDVYISKNEEKPKLYHLGHLQTETKSTLTGFTPAVPLELSPGDSLDIIIRCRSFYRLRAPLRILPQKQFLYRNVLSTFYYGTISGIILIILIQTILIFFETGKKRYIYLSLYIISVFMFIFIGYGILRALLPINNNSVLKYLLQRGTIQSTGLICMSLILYHLDLYKHLNPGSCIVKLMILAMVPLLPLSITLYFAGHYNQISTLFSLYLFLTVTLIIVIDIKNHKQMDRFSRNFFYSFLPPALFIIYRLLNSCHILPYYSYSSLFFPLLITVQTAILSYRSRLEIKFFKDAEKAAENRSLRQQEEVEQMIHQIKNPLSNILHMTDVLQEKEMIQEQCHRILSYMDARSLLFDPDGQNPITYANISLHSVLQDVYTRQMLSARKKEIELLCPEMTKEIHIVSHKELLTQILEEFVVNAIKYTPDNGRILISCTEQDGMISISVEDNGPGIPYFDRETIFMKGVRLSVSNITDADGDGLGLYRIFHLSKRMGIGLEYRDAKPHGSIFSLVLPAVVSYPEHECQTDTRSLSGQFQKELGKNVKSHDEASGTSVTNFTLLIIEDEQYMRNRLIEIFKTECKITACTDGQQALDYLENTPVLPDLILCDNYMPRLTGMELLEKMNNLSSDKRSIPVIIHSAVVSYKHRKEAYLKGAVGYIEKPCSAEELRLCISSCLEKIRVQKNLIRYKTLKEVEQKARGYLLPKQGPGTFYPRSTSEEIKGKTKDVLQLIGQGMNKKQIRETLEINERTLKDYLNNLYDHFGIRNFIRLQALIEETCDRSRLNPP